MCPKMNWNPWNLLNIMHLFQYGVDYLYSRVRGHCSMWFLFGPVLDLTSQNGMSWKISNCQKSKLSETFSISCILLKWMWNYGKRSQISKVIRMEVRSSHLEVKGHINTYPSFSGSGFVSWGSSILSNFVIVFSVLLVSSDILLPGSCSFSVKERCELAGSVNSESSNGLPGSLDRLDDAKLLLEDRVFLDPCLLKGSASIQIHHDLSLLIIN